MPSQRRRDDRPIQRRGPQRSPKLRLLIVCEGRETERGYFKAFKQAVRNPLVHIDIAKETGVPLTVVQIAIDLRAEAEAEAKRNRDENLKYDEVWGVFDVDDHPNLERARSLAREGAIHLAVSNPCFELWALLHFRDQRAHVERHKLRAMVQEHLPGYEKSLDFSRVHSGYTEACARAEALAREAERSGTPGRNPSTGVHHLTESIRRGGAPR